MHSRIALVASLGTLFGVLLHAGSAYAGDDTSDAANSGSDVSEVALADRSSSTSPAATSLIERIGLVGDAAHGGLPGGGTNNSPRFTRSDTPAGSEPSAPGLRNESSEMAYRWWVSSGRADLGLGLGAVALTTRPTGAIPGLVNAGGSTVVASGTVLTLGMRYRTSAQSSFFADASSWRGNGLDNNDGGVAGKVGLEFKSAQSRFNIAYGGLGMRLTGDSKMTVRLRRGGLGLFMHRAF